MRFLLMGVVALHITLLSCDSLDEGQNDYFEKTLGFSLYEVGQALCKTDDGGFVIAGNTRSIRDNQDFYISKIDGNGNVQWSKTFGGSGTDQCHALTQTTDGSYLVTGRMSTLTNRNDILSIKIGVFGEMIWSRIIGNRDDQETRGVAPTADGGAVISGYTGSPADLYLARFSATGDSIWARVYGKPNGFDYSRGLVSTTGGDFLVTGYTNSFGSTYQPFITKINAVGQELWTSVIPVNSRTEIYGMTVDTDGSIVLVGRAGVLPAPVSAVLLKTDAQGQVLWIQYLTPSNVNEANAIVATVDAYVITGRTYLGSTTGDTNMLLAKTDKNGNVIWVRAYGGSRAEVGWDVQTVDRGGYLAIGATESFGQGNSDIYLVKVNESGDIE